MARVLITGINGFIGSHIADRMLANGFQVAGLVRKSSDLSLINGKNIELFYGDVTDPESLKPAVAGADLVIHNAGLASDWGPLELFLKINFEGTKNLAMAAVEAKVKRFVLMSSTAIHGFGSPEAMNEESPIKTHGFHYSISKWEAERWLFDFAKNTAMEVSAIRPGNVFGPRDHTFIEKYLDVMVKGNGGYVSGGRSRTCPVYIGNLTQGIYLAAIHPKAVGQSFIITDGLEITWREFTDMLADAMKIKRPGMSIPYPVGIAVASLMEFTYKLFNSKSAPVLTTYRIHNGGKDYHFSIDKAKKLLGFIPETSLPDALAATVKWYKEKNKLA